MQTKELLDTGDDTDVVLVVDGEEHTKQFFLFLFKLKILTFLPFYGFIPFLLREHSSLFVFKLKISTEFNIK